MTRDEIEKLLDGTAPGPWQADGEPWNRIVWSSVENRVCFMAHSNGLDDARDIATSNLVAAAPDLARLCLSLMDQLTEAQAAQATLVEKAASVLDKHDCAPLVPHPNWPEAEQEGYRNAQLDVAGSWKSAIRALAPDAGVQALAEWKRLAVSGNLIALEMRTVEADRDRLADELDEARAQMAGLRGAVEDIAKQKTTEEIIATEDIGMCSFEDGYDAIIGVARAALAAAEGAKG